MLPVVHSLFDVRALATCVAGHYPIGPIQACRLWRSFINDVYRLDAGGHRWWLRIHPTQWRTQLETQAEVEAVLSISAAGGSVARPVAQRNGSYLVEIEAPEGLRTAVLFEDAPGSDLKYVGSEGVVNARRYGDAVARLHDACDTVQRFSAREPMGLDLAVVRPADTLARHLGADDQADLARITNRLRETLLSRDDLTMGFCHGDLNSSNFHFHEDSAAAIDFDFCSWGWRAFELAAFARGVTWHSRPGSPSDVLVSAYLGGYGAHRPISEADIAVQPAMLLAQRLWVTAVHLDGADRWGSLNFGQAYAARAMDWLRDWERCLDTAPAASG